MWKTLRNSQHHILISDKGEVIVYRWNGKKVKTEDVLHIVKGRRRIGSHNYYNVYRLVDFAFRGPLPEGYHVHHIDFDKSNDSLDNLQRIPASLHIQIHGQHHENYSQPHYYSLKTQRNLLQILIREEFDLEELDKIYKKYIKDL